MGSPGAYGPEVQTAVRDHDRIYVVCNVPETGTQTQLTLSKENRPTTVATFEPGTDLLAVRAPDDGTADATVRAVTRYLDADGATRVSFLDGGFRGRFEDACVDGYSTLRLRNTNAGDNTREIEVRSEESDDGRVSDVRHDAIVRTLLRRGDCEIDAATGLVTVADDAATDRDDSPRRRVTIGFPDGRVTFDQFVPERVLIRFDNVVRTSLRR
ncbi:hypothetical protein [Halorussus caseinilyticus]|uniref:Uncharacterized protein n=1 Tax=Halorussus caseinilyticus TaxID=3034025 RepID=A0ABD5WM45_9EURY